MSNIFSNFSADVYLPVIDSAVSFSLDEKGVVAAAASGMVNMTSPGVARSVKFDSPFIYLVRERSTNTILFIGRQNRF